MSDIFSNPEVSFESVPSATISDRLSCRINETIHYVLRATTPVAH